jgi:hypothetical protein
MAKMILYITSFSVLFLAELCGNFHALATVGGKRQIAALTGAMSSVLWCVKIVIVTNQPMTIISGFFGAYFGGICAWKIGIARNYPTTK